MNYHPFGGVTVWRERELPFMQVVNSQQQDEWAHAQLGDSRAFAGQYARHADRVYSHCLQRGCSHQDAEDLTAEVFALAWQNRSKVHYHDEAGILPWLLVTGNNLLRHRSRALARARKNIERLLPERGSADTAVEVTDRAEQHCNLQRLATVLETLRPGDQDLIQLCIIQGFTPTTVAAVLGVQPGTVRVRLSRALDRARRAFTTQTFNY